MSYFTSVYCKRCKTIYRMKEVFDRHGYICPVCHVINDAQSAQNNQKVDDMKIVQIKKRPAFQIFELSFMSQRGVIWKNDYQPIINIIKDQIPISARSYDPDTKIWEIGLEFWPALEQLFISFNFKILYIPEFKNSGPNIDVPKEYEKNFFHEPAAPVTSEEDRSTVEKKLSTLLGMPVDIIFDDAELKKLYRKKAREYHPDFGGDAAKMSELNRLYTIYTSK